VASLAACSTGGGRDWVEERRWVKGVQTGRKAGRRQESLPHIGGLPHESGLASKNRLLTKKARNKHV